MLVLMHSGPVDDDNKILYASYVLLTAFCGGFFVFVMLLFD